MCGRRRILATSAPVSVMDVYTYYHEKSCVFLLDKCDACVPFALGPLSESSVSVRLSELFRSMVFGTKGIVAVASFLFDNFKDLRYFDVICSRRGSLQSLVRKVCA